MVSALIIYKQVISQRSTFATLFLSFLFEFLFYPL